MYCREDALLEAVAAFYGDRLFGPRRRELLAADLAAAYDSEAQERDAEREKIGRQLAGLVRRQGNVLRQAEDCEPGDDFGHALRRSYLDLEHERRGAQERLAVLDRAATCAPTSPDSEVTRLLDALPMLALTLRRAPAELLCALFEVTRLGVQLHEDDTATITVTLPADQIAAVSATAARVQAAKQPVTSTDTGCGADSVRAPGGTRTASATSTDRRELIVTATVALPKSTVG